MSYWQCWKCGAIAESDDADIYAGMCVAPIRWNIGIIIIRLGYNIRGRNADANNKSPWYRWYIGRFILGEGYKLRGDCPKKTWKWNHI